MSRLVPSEHEIRLDPLLQHGQPLLLEPPALRMRKRGGVELGERRPTPQAEGFAERRRSLSGLLTVRLVDELLEPVEVELARRQP